MALIITSNRKQYICSVKKKKGITEMYTKCLFVKNIKVFAPCIVLIDDSNNFKSGILAF